MQNTLTYDLKDAINNNKKLINYNSSTLIHSFDLTNKIFTKIDINNSLEKMLTEAYLGNGDIRVYTHNLNYISICYETTDTYEFSECFAEQLAEQIDDIVKQYIATQ